ncbi:hypothetical protein ACIBUY_28175 [Streptomyces sp. NPDC050085]|uniref:hypothetical protein n=1 Tax=Streptomyces sp. NPDC050085 TaxID=3365600 RepID=UPI00379CB68B
MARLAQMVTAPAAPAAHGADAETSYRHRALARHRTELVRSAQHAVAQWPQLKLPEQRAQLAAHVREVVLRPAPRGRWFDPATVDIHWTDAVAEAS